MVAVVGMVMRLKVIPMRRTGGTTGGDAPEIQITGHCF
jgi:hypothetical protein